MATLKPELIPASALSADDIEAVRVIVDKQVALMDQLEAALLSDDIVGLLKAAGELVRIEKKIAEA